MKRQSTTLVSKTNMKRISLVVLSFFMVISGSLAISQHTAADNWDTQIAQLRRQADQYQAQANALGEQARTLQVELDRLTNEKNAIQAQLNLSQAKYNQLQEQITETTVKIAANKDVLGETIADMYLSDTVTPLELLAGSDSITDYIDQQNQRESVRDTLSTTIDEINALKKQLETQQAEVKVILERQKAQEAQLAAKEAEQAQIVEKTRGEEAAFQGLVAQAQQQMQTAAAQQRAYYDSLRARNGSSGVNGGVVGSFTYGGWSGNLGCSGGYPYCGPLDSHADPWGLYNRECVSYVAWALVHRFGKYVGHFSGAGNAADWVWSAPRYSGAYRVYDPQPGDVVVLPAIPGFAPVGHVMIVESASGGNIRVSQYNFYGTGQYSTMNVGTSGVVFLRFRDR